MLGCIELILQYLCNASNIYNMKTVAVSNIGEVLANFFKIIEFNYSYKFM